MRPGVTFLLPVLVSGQAYGIAQGPVVAPRDKLPVAVSVRIRIDAPGAPRGTPLRVRFVQGPDSLRAQVREYPAPTEFTLQAPMIAFEETRANGWDLVSVEVQRLDLPRGESQGPSTATGDRVRAEIKPEGVLLTTSSFQLRGWLPWIAFFLIGVFVFSRFSYRLSRR